MKMLVKNQNKIDQSKLKILHYTKRTISIGQKYFIVKQKWHFFRQIWSHCIDQSN